jgi:hypothetical protein
VLQPRLALKAFQVRARVRGDLQLALHVLVRVDHGLERVQLLLLVLMPHLERVLHRLLAEDVPLRQLVDRPAAQRS